MATLQEDKQDEKYNPAQDLYNQEFNPTKASDGDEEVPKKGTHRDSHGDIVQNNPNADIEDVKDKEESGGSDQPKSPSPIQRGSVLSGMFKGKGRGGKLVPSFGIGLLFAGGVGAMSIFMLPAALLVAIEKAVTNDGSDSSRTNIVMRRAYIGSMIGKGDCSKKVKCKMTTMNESQKKHWERLGFQIEADKDGDRHKVKSITSPDGTKMTSGKQFNAWADSSLENRRLVNRVVNTRAAFFQNSKFNKVLSKYKISKGKKLESSRDRDKEKRKAAIDKSFNTNTEVGEDKKGGLTRMRSALDKGKAKASKVQMKGAGVAAAALAIACTSYNTVRATTAVIKAEWIYQLIKFAYPFIQAAAQIEDQGNIEPEVVENLADRLTWYQSADTADTAEEKSKVNLTAMDSQGLQMAIYGDFTGLKDFTKDYTTAKMSYAIVGSQVINTIQKTLGKDNIRLACQASNVASVLSSASCLAGPVAIGICAAAVAAVVLVGDDLVAEAAKMLAEPAMKAIEDANLTSDLKGVDAGNALAAGVGLMLSSTSMGYGLRPSSNVGQVNKFITSTNGLYYKYGEELARYEAKDTPFDIYNEYSFAGKLASLFNPYRSTDGTPYSQFANIFATAASSMTRILPTANALYSQPSNMTLQSNAASNRTGKCEDTDMKDIGAICDWSGRMIGYTSDSVLSKSNQQADGDGTMILSTIDYMLDNKYIDEDGKPQGDEKSDHREYFMYKTYCTEEREDPLGTSQKSITEGSEDDQKWYSGERCLGKEQKDQDMLNNFAIYFNYCESQVPTADGVENCWTDTPVATTTSGSAETNTGDWVIPTSGQCLSAYGQRGGTLHAGVDISPPQGTPIVAPTSMKIISAGDKNDGYGYSVVARATDGTNYMFRFGHMVAQPPVKSGQEVSKGTLIGNVGSTGNSTGPHLHFEIYDPSSPDGAYASNGKPVDPIPILTKNGVSLSCQSNG